MQRSRNATVPALTGVRGLAALLVAVYHYFLPVMPPGSIARHLLGRGYLYVDLFFILSGYVMALTYGAAFAERRTPPSSRASGGSAWPACIRSMAACLRSC